MAISRNKIENDDHDPPLNEKGVAGITISLTDTKPVPMSKNFAISFTTKTKIRKLIL